MRRMRQLVCASCAAAALCLAVADDEETKLLPDGAGREIVARMCFECHGAGNFRKARLNRDDWADQVADMVDRGAKGTEVEITAVVEYLSRNFGKDSKINVNTAPLLELKIILGISAKEAQAVVEYREANGRVHAWTELQRVPGVDGTKIEAQKDLMVI